jgi:mannose-6-phosphate isomerase-like protein (cupin superfamily)
MQYFIVRNVGDLGPRIVLSRDAEDVYMQSSAAHHEMTRMDWSNNTNPMQAEFGVLVLKGGERSAPIPESTVGYLVMASGSGIVDAGGRQVPLQAGDCLVVDSISHCVIASEDGCVVATTSVPVSG